MKQAILPIDIDWTMELMRDVAHFLYKSKREIDDTTAPLLAVDLLEIVNSHIVKNNLKLVKTE